jgi:uncharacterized lipoprotein YddW (UPF0748 family)
MSRLAWSITFPRVFRLLAAAASILLAAHGSYAEAGEFRAMWASTMSVRTPERVDQMLDELVAGNYNAVVAEVLSFYDRATTGHGAYWNSALVPKSTNVSAAYDPVAYLCQAAHARGIEVHAWVLPYWASTTDIWSPGQDGGNPTIAAHPEWLMVRQAGMDLGPLPLDDGDPATLQDRYVMDCGAPEVQDYIISVLRELVTNYPIDGVNLDGIRYRQLDAGYPSVSSYQNSGLARYRRIYGLLPSDPNYLPAPTGVATWDDFRRREVDELVRRLRAEIPTWPNPRQPVRLTADLIAGTVPLACDSFATTTAYRGLFQNWQLWMERGWLDAAMPMNYQREHCPAEAAIFRGWVRFTMNCSASPRHVFMGQGCFRNDATPPDRFTNTLTQMRYCYDGAEHRPVDGVINFSYTGIRSAGMTCENPGVDSSVSDADWWPRVAADLYTQPATTPEMPWRSRTQAVEGTIWGRVLFNDLPVDDATVTFGHALPSYTDGNGYYVATLLPAARNGSSYTVGVIASGYPPAIHPAARVLPGEVVRYDFSLGVPPPEMAVSIDSIERTVRFGEPIPPASFTVTGLAGRAPLNYYVAVPGAPFWITPSPETGTSSGEADAISVTFAAGLPTGWHFTTLDIADAAASNSPYTVSVRLTVTPPGDSDGDLDVDQEDFGVFQRCLGNAGAAIPGCEAASFDGDSDVDEADFSKFLNCMRQPRVPAPGDCAD